mgnify:CR=1 FL=1
MTATTDERATLGETYGLATHSGNLRVQEKRGDADIIMAAGFVAQRMERMGRVAPGLGITLLRLQTEFDGVRAALAMADRELPRIESMAKALERRADAIENSGDAWPQFRPEQLREDASTLRRAAKEQALTERLLALMELKTLREGRQAVGIYAHDLAEHERFMAPPAVIHSLAGRVLDVFLDPRCHLCHGTGQVGSGYLGETMRQCDRCGGSGHRRDSIGNNDRAKWFAFLLLGDMQRAVALAAGGMGRVLRNEE